MAQTKFKYLPGSFSIVSNLDILEGKHPILQCIYMWLCKYANEDGTCNPSQGTLAEKCGTTKKTVIKYISQMEELGILEKTHRFVNGEQTTNLYQIYLIEIVKEEEPEQVGGVGATLPSVGGTHRTIPSSKDKKKSIKEKVELAPEHVPFESCPLVKEKSAEWQEMFQQYFDLRVRKREPITPNILRIILKDFKKYSEEVQVQALKKSVIGNYIGVFPESVNKISTTSSGNKNNQGYTPQHTSKKSKTLEEIHAEQMASLERSK